MKVVCNSGPLIALSKVGKLEVLRKLFGEIFISETVWNELVEKGRNKSGSKEVEKAEWIKVRKVLNRLSVQLLLKEVDVGEAETIVLAKELNAGLVLMDDEVPREIAKSLELNVAGTIAVLFEAWKRSILTQNPVEVALEMKARGVWLSNELINKLKEMVSNDLKDGV
ncbi:MAG: DUF3368 domain-containing protein [Candidatus Baldrarchaeia archaeon]